MATLEELQKNRFDEWDAFVLGHKNGSIYHTSSWQSIIRSAYGHRPLYIILKDKIGNIIGGMPLFLVKGFWNSMRIISVPCAQTCNPLFNCQTDYDKILEYLNYVMREYRCRYAEIRTTTEIDLATKSYRSKRQNYSIYILDLNKPLDKIRQSFHKSCIRRAIEKANKSAIHLAEGESEVDLREFYNLYLAMRKRYGLLPQPFSFFKAMWRELHHKGQMDVLLAKVSGKVVSSLILLKFKDRVTYEYGASNAEMLNIRPSHFLLWEGIKKAATSGYKEFDFGRTEDENIGLSEFKSRWGTRREALTYYLLYDGNAEKPARENDVGKEIMNFLISKFPVWLSEKAAQMLYRYLV